MTRMSSFPRLRQFCAKQKGAALGPRLLFICLLTRIPTPTGRMGHTLQLYIVHRMKALPKIPPLTGLDNFFRCGAGALARERFWVAQRLKRCDSAYVTTTLAHPCHYRPASAVRNLLSQA